MIVVVTVAKVKFLVFCNDDSNSNRKVNKRRTVYGKLVGKGSVMENYAECGSSYNRIVILTTLTVAKVIF